LKLVGALGMVIKHYDVLCLIGNLTS
jgi:hypothetical protein